MFKLSKSIICLQDISSIFLELNPSLVLAVWYVLMVWLITNFTLLICIDSMNKQTSHFANDGSTAFMSLSMFCLNIDPQ